MRVVTDLAEAISRRDWPAALAEALARWRAHRSIAWGTLVATLGRRVPEAAVEADDPRFAMQLAAWLVAHPRAPAAKEVAEQLAALRYALAIAQALSAAEAFEQPVQHVLVLAGSDGPHASDVEARALVRAVDDPDGTVDGLWREVIEAPGELERRLVLADALLDRGDPRGELIALQCRPGGHHEGAHLLEARRFELLGETALILNAGSQFRGGLLASVSVGTAHTPPAAYDQPLDPRELCALHDVSPGYVTAPRYAKFLAGLARMPAWVRIERTHLRELRSLGARCAFRNVEFSLYPPPRDLAGELLAIAAYAPTLEGIAIRVGHWPPLATCLEVAREVRARVPQLQRFLVALMPNHGNADEILDEASASPDLELVDAPSPPWLADWR